MNEKALIKQCLKNDRIAQRLLFMNYKDAMFSVLYRLLGNVEDAEESLQDGFIKVFNNLKSFEGKSTIGAWMKTIFVREALQKMRKLQIEEVNEQQIEQSGFLSFDDALTGQIIEEAILSLDDGFRAVFLLVEVEGYKHKEVAAMLNISEGTSKSQLSRAKQKLRTKLASLGY